MAKVIWFYGLSGSGKTTIADLADEMLRAEGNTIMRLDADALRAELWPEVDLTRHGRIVNVDRLTCLCRRLYDADITTIVSASAPFEEQRVKALEMLPSIKFIKVDTPIDVCVQRKPRVYNNVWSVTQIDSYPAPYAVISGTLTRQSLEKNLHSILHDDSNETNAILP